MSKLNPAAVLMAFSAVLATSVAANAQEICVHCTGPVATYRCVVEGASPGAAQASKLECITALARDGGHEICGVKSGGAPECAGTIKRIAAPEAVEIKPPPVVVAEPPAVAPPVVASPAVPKDAKSAEAAPPPATMEELARQMAKSSGEQLNKTGEQINKAGTAVGDAAKKTWTCLTSLFKSC